MNGQPDLPPVNTQLPPSSQPPLRPILPQTQPVVARRKKRLIILAVAALCLLIGVAAAYLLVFNKPDSAKNSVQTSQQSRPDCTADAVAAKVCTFIDEWNKASNYTMKTTSASGDIKLQTVFEKNEVGNYHMSTSGDISYEIIGFGQVLYTFDSSDNNWWKQTLASGDLQKYTSDFQVDFDKPGLLSNGELIKYEPAAEDKCTVGNTPIVCDKFEIKGSNTATDIKRYVWLINGKTLYRYRIETSDGYTDSVFSYDRIAINEPTKTKDLPNGKLLIPGKNEPVDIANSAGIKDVLDKALRKTIQLN